MCTPYSSSHKLATCLMRIKYLKYHRLRLPCLHRIHSCMPWSRSVWPTRRTMDASCGDNDTWPPCRRPSPSECRSDVRRLRGANRRWIESCTFAILHLTSLELFGEDKRLSSVCCGRCIEYTQVPSVIQQGFDFRQLYHQDCRCWQKIRRFTGILNRFQ